MPEGCGRGGVRNDGQRTSRPTGLCSHKPRAPMSREASATSEATANNRETRTASGTPPSTQEQVRLDIRGDTHRQSKNNASAYTCFVCTHTHSPVEPIIFLLASECQMQPFAPGLFAPRTPSEQKCLSNTMPCHKRSARRPHFSQAPPVLGAAQQRNGKEANRVDRQLLNPTNFSP